MAFYKYNYESAEIDELLKDFGICDDGTLADIIKSRLGNDYDLNCGIKCLVEMKIKKIIKEFKGD